MVGFLLYLARDRQEETRGGINPDSMQLIMFFLYIYLFKYVDLVRVFMSSDHIYGVITDYFFNCFLKELFP